MRKLLYIAVFTSGLVSLAVEMSASRLLGNYFGTSNLVWASIIGLILIYLTVGYFLGGRWADRSPNYATLFKILAWAAFAIGLVPLISRPLLRITANAFDELQFGVMIGSFVTVMVLFCIPVTLLGTASPFAIRLALVDSRQAGTIAGRIYAISTLGSFIGTFLPDLLLIPLIGTYRTFLVFSGLLLIVSLTLLAITSGFRKSLPYAWMPVVIIILAIFGVQGADKATEGLVYETESSYNYIQVIEQDDYTMLRLNEGQGIHSIYHPTQLNYLGPWEQVLVAPFFNPAPYSPTNIKKMAIVGLAAGTTARQATQVFGPIQIDGYEIDPKIIQVGKDYFDMNEPNLNIFVQDGRVGLSQSGQIYQIISIDAYHPPYIPWHLTTQEFFQIVRDHLSEDGVMVINVGRSSNDRSIVDALGSTIATVFPSVHVMDLPYSFNSILFATVKPTSDQNLLDNFTDLESTPGVNQTLLETMQITIQNLQPTPAQGIVFTDDQASIEWITNKMILSFLVSGEVETLQ